MLHVGARVRHLRTRRGMSARALATALDISPSAVSQIERGVLQPSISRLIAIADALEVPLATVFDDATLPAPVAAPVAEAGFVLQRSAQSSSVELDGGVTLRPLSPVPCPGIDYFESTYPPGTAAHQDGELFRHDGYEVGTVTAGELTIDFDAERVILRPGDSISYASSQPHRIHNTGTADAVARWLIVHSGS